MISQRNFYGLPLISMGDFWRWQLSAYQYQTILISGNPYFDLKTRRCETKINKSITKFKHNDTCISANRIAKATVGIFIYLIY